MARKRKYATLSSADLTRILKQYFARHDTKIVGRLVEFIAVTDDEGRLEIEVWVQ